MKDANAEPTGVHAVRVGQRGGDEGLIDMKRQFGGVVVAEVARAHHRRVKGDAGGLEGEAVDRAVPDDQLHPRRRLE